RCLIGDGGGLLWNTAMGSSGICAFICLIPSGGCSISTGRTGYIRQEGFWFRKTENPTPPIRRQLHSNTLISNVFGITEAGAIQWIPNIRGRLKYTATKEPWLVAFGNMISHLTETVRNCTQT